jgi:hypothetical protein
MENQNFKIEKTTVECYKIRHESGMYWADITIDVTSDRSGRISISSDYGNYANYWGACGRGFKQFLIDLNLEYTADKFGADRWFDLESTLKTYKNRVLEIRKEERMGADVAREIWTQIQELEDCSNISEFEARMWDKSKLMWMYDHCPDINYDITPQFKKFWKTVWPIFIDAIMAEIIVDATAVN